MVHGRNQLELMTLRAGRKIVSRADELFAGAGICGSNWW